MMSTQPRRGTLTTIDAHAGGEPLRLIDLRRILMFEPRGHSDMYGAILTSPVTPEADNRILLMHNEGYSTMCGHGFIAVTTILIETGQVSATNETVMIGYDAPAGFLRARVTVVDGRGDEVTFENVPSFVLAAGVLVETPFGSFEVPVVCGGAFYAPAPAPEGLTVDPANVRALIDHGMTVKWAVECQVEVVHPLDPGLHGIYGTIITGEPSNGAEGRNVTIFADGEVDRSPCGTGTAARLAWLHQPGQLPVERPYIHESIIGSRFSGRVLREMTVGDRPAVIPEIAGSARITGYHTFVVEPDDPIGAGFLVR